MHESFRKMARGGRSRKLINNLPFWDWRFFGQFYMKRRSHRRRHRPHHRRKTVRRGGSIYQRMLAKGVISRKELKNYRSQKRGNMVGYKQTHEKNYGTDDDMNDLRPLNENKYVVNDFFSDYVAAFKLRLPRNVSTQVVVLDAEERNSSKWLLKKDIPKENIWLVEERPRVATKHINAGFNTFPGDLERYAVALSREPKNKKPRVCLGVYFDMCGLVRAQRKGILDTIQQLDNIVDGTMLVFTFNITRDRVVGDAGSPEVYESTIKPAFKENVAQVLLSKYGLVPDWSNSAEKVDQLCQKAKQISADKVARRAAIRASQNAARMEEEEEEAEENDEEVGEGENHPLPIVRGGANDAPNIDFFYAGPLCEQRVTRDGLMNVFSCICRRQSAQVTDIQ